MNREPLCGVWRGRPVEFCPLSARESLALPRVAAQLLAGWLEALPEPEALYPAAHNAALLYFTLRQGGEPAFTACEQVAEILSFEEIAGLADLYQQLCREEAGADA